MVYTSVYSTLPFLAEETAAQLEIGQELTCIYGGIMPFPATVAERNGRKLMRVEAPDYFMPDEAIMLEATFNDDPVLFALVQSVSKS